MEYPNKNIKLVEELKLKNIIKSQKVASAMKKVDRGDFVDLLPYYDCPAPVGYSQNVPAPHIHAMILVKILK